jgi:hypothetical protein
MQTIETRYKGPSAARPAQIIAKTSAGKILRMSRWKAEELAVKMQSPDAYGNADMESIHRAAAMELARKLDWQAEWICGGTKNGFVFVMLPKGTVLAKAVKQ